MWSWLSYDYDNTVSIDDILANAKSIKGGDILVFHDNLKSHDRLKVLLPKVVDVITEKGLHFQSVD
jgi:hypothetical protein